MAIMIGISGSTLSPILSSKYKHTKEFHINRLRQFCIYQDHLFCVRLLDQAHANDQSHFPNYQTQDQPRDSPSPSCSSWRSSGWSCCWSAMRSGSCIMSHSLLHRSSLEKVATEKGVSLEKLADWLQFTIELSQRCHIDQLLDKLLDSESGLGRDSCDEKK